MMELTEKTLSRTDIFEGKVVSLHVDTVELPDGTTSIREVVEHVDGVAVLPLDEGEFLNVERIPFEELYRRVCSGEVDDAKTVTAVLKTKLLLNL